MFRWIGIGPSIAAVFIWFHKQKKWNIGQSLPRRVFMRGIARHKNKASFPSVAVGNLHRIKYASKEEILNQVQDDIIQKGENL